MRDQRSSLRLALAVLAIASCDGGPPPVGSLTALTTAELSGVVGKPLTFQVRVDDEKGRPLSKYPIKLTPAAGSGSIAPAQLESDATGLVSVQWTLGTTAGAQSVVASAGGQSVTIGATALPDAPASLALRTGSGQTGAVGDPLAIQPVVRVRDQHGNGVPGVEVAFSVAAGGGTLAASSARSNASGDVSVPWTLGPTLGEQAAAAAVAGVEPLRISANAVPGPPARVSLVSGGGQTGTVARPLATALVFEARDRFGNLAVGGRLDLRGDGTAAPAPGTAGSDGRVTTTWTLGTRAGAQSMRAIAGTADSAAASGTANAGPPRAATRVGGDGQRGFAGGVLADSLTVLLKDEFDNPVPGAEVSFVVTGGSGSVTPGTQATRANGLASAAWRLGTAVGANALEARPAGLTALPFTAISTSGPPASIGPVSGDAQTAGVTTALPAPVALRVRDAFGNAVQGAAVDLAAGSGGTVSPTRVVTDTVGVASFRWTLGRGAGLQAVTATAGSAVGHLSATGLAGPFQQMAKADVDGQTAAVGTAVRFAPWVETRDAFGNRVSGVAVTYAVTGGGGSITGASPTSDAQGVARVGSWTLGPTPGRNTLSVTATGAPPVEFTAEAAVPDNTYSIEVVWVGAQAPSGTAQSAVASAVGRWQRAIAGDLSNISFSVGAGACGIAHPAYTNRAVDDLIVLAEVAAIDGAGSILAQAGPCLVRNSNGTTAVGIIRMDQDDVSRLDATSLSSVLAHEIGHVIGIGTLSAWYGSLAGAGGADPYFTGPTARARFAAAGGAAPNPVPVESLGGAGTRDAHWRESTMGRELMTGYLNAGVLNPLSAISIGALADMGYSVNYGAADSYTVAPSAPTPFEVETIELHDDILRIPIGTVPDGGPAPR